MISRLRRGGAYCPIVTGCQTKTINPCELGLDANGPMTVEGVTATFEEMRIGIEEGETRLIWIGNRRIGKIEIQEQQWVTNANLNLENYRQVLLGRSMEIKHRRWNSRNCAR